MRKINSRRSFLKEATLGGIGAAMGIGTMSSVHAKTEAGSATTTLSVHPRYYRWHVDPGVEWLETNTDYATLSWNIPVAQAALVLVDVWQRHYIKDTEARAEVIINNNLAPLIAACRRSGLQVIHAPSPPVAQLHPNWVNLVPASEMNTKRDTWPPPSFRNLSGSYQSYHRPIEPREEERQQLPPLTFHPKIIPVGEEAVIATGEELHRYCKKKGILFLLYAGFNTNACLITRDYGMLQMCNDRGYQTILVRDCTTGMESRYTQTSLGQTEGAILFFEMFGQYSVTSSDIIDGLSTKA